MVLRRPGGSWNGVGVMAAGSHKGWRHEGNADIGPTLRRVM